MDHRTCIWGWVSSCGTPSNTTQWWKTLYSWTFIGTPQWNLAWSIIYSSTDLKKFIWTLSRWKFRNKITSSPNRQKTSNRWSWHCICFRINPKGQKNETRVWEDTTKVKGNQTLTHDDTYIFTLIMWKQMANDRRWLQTQLDILGGSNLFH